MTKFNKVVEQRKEANGGITKLNCQGKPLFYSKPLSYSSDSIHIEKLYNSHGLISRERIVTEYKGKNKQIEQYYFAYGRNDKKVYERRDVFENSGISSKTESFYDEAGNLSMIKNHEPYDQLHTKICTILFDENETVTSRIKKIVKNA